MPFQLGIITDEIAPDLETALTFASQYGLEHCELREVWGKNIMNLSRAELDHARSLIAASGLRVSVIDSPVFKWNLPEAPARPGEHDEFGAHFTDHDSDKLLIESFEIARFFGASKVRVFSFWRIDDPEKAYPFVRDRLASAAGIAGQNGITLVLENEHACNVGTGKELGRILKDINSQFLRGNWDPGNAAMFGETPYPDGYQNLEGLASHMHVKDVTRDEKDGRMSWAPVGGGFINWKGQLQALQKLGGSFPISLETHYREPGGSKIESTRQSLSGLLKILREIAA